MLTTSELLAAAKAKQNISSNYRLARVLNIPDNTVQRWHTGKTKPDDDMCVRLAGLAGLDPGQVVASIRAERCEPGPMRDVWAGVAERLARVGVGATTAAMLLGVTGGPDAPAYLQPSAQSAAPTDAVSARLMIMSTRFLRSAARWFRAWQSTAADSIIPFGDIPVAFS